MAYYDIGAFEYVDTDDDGLPDWWELRYFGTATAANPAVDEEPDGLTNLDEYRFRTDPLSADTDGDGRNDVEEIADVTNPWHPDNAEKTYYVNNITGSDTYDGLAASYDGTHGPKLTIQAGIDATVSGWSYTVLVSDGMYTGDGNRDLDLKGKAIVLASENGAENCIIDCESYTRGLYVTWNRLISVVDGFTIQNGYGGGIFCAYSKLVISNCTITDNTAIVRSTGGGVCCVSSSPTITNCTISENSAYSDGGGDTLLKL